MAYRPVMHKNIGLLFDEEPNEYWENVYSITDVDQNTFFPMEAIADKNLLKPYFNAGLLVVRPNNKVFQTWDTYFKKLSMDPSMIELCKNTSEKYNVFLHQAALVGAILNNVDKEELELLPFAYNYPIFFEKFYGS